MHSTLADRESQEVRRQKAGCSDSPGTLGLMVFTPNE